MIRHDAFLELAAVAIDFELSAAERSRLEAHLAACPACLRTASALHADARSLAALPVVRLAERRADQLLDRVLATPRASLGSLRLLAVAALLTILAVGAVLVGAELLRRADQDDPLVVVPSPSASVAPDASPVADNGVGMRWERTDIPESAVSQPGGATIGGVIAGGPGAIAWGFVYGSEPRIWTTSDGRTWERATVPVPSDADPEYQEPGSVNAVVAAGSGYIATGHYYRLGTGRRALIWTSVDGRAWELLPHDPAFENAIANDIVPWRGELLAFGQWSAAPGGGATPARLWSSRDGVTWASEELSLPTGLTMSFAAATADRLWATASPEGDDTAGSEAVVILSSDDGRTWSRSDLPFSRGRLIAIGRSLLTLVPPWPLAAPDFTPPPTPPGQLSPGLYRAADNDAWEPVSRGLSAAANDLIQVGATLILVGDDSTGDPRCWEDCQATGWRSIDGGVSWQAVPADVVGGTMASVAAVPGGRLVAVGHVLDDQGNPTPAAWVSEPAGAPSASPGILAVTHGDETGGTWVELVRPDKETVSPFSRGRDPGWVSDRLFIYTCAPQGGEPSIICTVDLTNVEPEAETQLAQDAGRPAPAPDGNLIAVHRGSTDVGETWLIRPDGKDQHRLAAGSFLQWSPDGRWLLGQPESATFEVAIVSVDGADRDPQVLAAGYDPAWSPAGDRIAYAVVSELGVELRVMTPFTNISETRYTAPAASELTAPTWLPDGALVFVLDGDLYRLEAGSNELVRLTTGLAIRADWFGDALAVSPDGRSIAFSTGSGADARVGIASVDGGYRMLDLGTGPITQPQWAPASFIPVDAQFVDPG